LKVSPINISVHTTNPELRNKMLGNPNGGRGIGIMKRFAEAGIIMNCQIVCCPGINDREELERSMTDLAGMHPNVNSVSIVPVGLTKHRDRLFKLKPFDITGAAETVKLVEEFSQSCLQRVGSRIFFCSDEFYIKAELSLPEDEFYEGYPQLENGVGMLRLLITEFYEALESKNIASPGPFSIATGLSAAPFLEKLVQAAKDKFDNIDGKVYAIINNFFGQSIDVAGLITGEDLIAQLRDKELGSRLLIPQNMLRHGEGVFLDDVTVEHVAEILGVPVVPVGQSGLELASAVLGYKAFN